MIHVGNYVRCPLDEDTANPRDFFYGQVIEINELKGECLVCFYSVNGVASYYWPMPQTRLKAEVLERCPAVIGCKASYGKTKKILGTIFALAEEKNGDYFYYFGESPEEAFKVNEQDLTISYNDGHANPLSQCLHYEFGNPVFFTNRVKTCMAAHDIERNLYGLTALAGAKIYLKPFQVKTIMRCVQTLPCRYMIADEVGLGKTIEALAVLCIYLTNRKGAKCAIIVPDSLAEQWKNELAFKFRLFVGINKNENTIDLIPHSQIVDAVRTPYDFVIIDEVHKILKDDAHYNAALSISENVENILMLSATPVQRRDEEYKRLLTLIQPRKYLSMSTEAFQRLHGLQANVTRRIYEAYQTIETLRSEVIASKGVLNEDVEDAFEDVKDATKKLSSLINDQGYDSLLEGVAFDHFDDSLKKFGAALLYASDVYQLEKSVIRNRRGAGIETTNVRTIQTRPYDLNSDFNNSEMNVYSALSDWANESDKQTFEKTIFPLIMAFFSSAHAFKQELGKISDKVSIPERVLTYTDKWVRESEKTLTNISNYLDEDVNDYSSRPVNVIDYLDQECSDKTVLVFADHPATFEYYKKLLLAYFNKDECCFFSKTMSRDELDLNAYRFEHIDSYHIMLSDSSGGEGRNFQNADAVLHIDIPWDANALEQRIGRLDRIGRKTDLPVLSVTFQAKGTIEEDLVNLWSDGVQIFRKAQSGIEIITGEISETILEALNEDFSFGLKNALPFLSRTINDLDNTIRLERHFDVSGYEYSDLNRHVDRAIERFNKFETNWLKQIMHSWAPVVGFNPDKDTSDQTIITFHSDSFSVGSAKKTFFIPPNMKRVIDDKINQMQNRIRALNSERIGTFGLNYIQGSLDRAVAINNDYLHFFAPGDPIFDSIIANALGMYRGQCAAVTFKGEVNWKGFAYFWIIKIDEGKLFDLGLNRRLVEQFKGYIPFVWTLDYASYDAADKTPIELVKKEFYNLLNKWRTMRYNNTGLSLGARESGEITQFKQLFPSRIWEKRVNEAYQESEERISNAINERVAEGVLKIEAEIDRIIRSNKRSTEYFNVSSDVEELEERKNDILALFKKPKIELSSICFMMIKK